MVLRLAAWLNATGTNPGTPAIPAGLVELGPFPYIAAACVALYGAVRQIKQIKQTDLKTTQEALEEQKAGRLADAKAAQKALAAEKDTHRRQTEALIKLHRADQAAERERHMEDVESLKGDIANQRTEISELRDLNFAQAKEAAAEREVLLLENAALRAFAASNNLDPKGVLPRVEPES